ncbi:MAG: phosphatidylserine/phosphatidylglycerophosphate/cardiolipin synthase family protein, partial [Flavobacteriales bacterium]|nr:phosphatidylserine/phosphatidylglycerophosphate/cardiolipin synthase family protein [Flavobacteriales bacterium]
SCTPKAAIMDDTALIGSANFTDDSFNRNMELGMLLHDPVQVASLSKHFADLEERGALRILHPRQH